MPYRHLNPCGGYVHESVFTTGCRKNIAVTGLRIYWKPASQPSRGMADISRIIAMDIGPPAVFAPGLSFFYRDIRESADEILMDNHIDTVVHLAFILKPTHKKKKAAEVDVDGTVRFLAGCSRAGVKNIIYLSSHTVYGAYPDNPSSITESCSTCISRFQYSEDKVKVNRYLMTTAGTSGNQAYDIKDLPGNRPSCRPYCFYGHDAISGNDASLWL
jgi:UDP-glucose 4-epimerase